MSLFQYEWLLRLVCSVTIGTLIGYERHVRSKDAGIRTHAIVALACTIPGAYALSRRDLPGRRPIMFLFTFTMFFNGGIIPMFLTIKSLGIYNTPWALVLPAAVSVYNLIAP